MKYELSRVLQTFRLRIFKTLKEKQWISDAVITSFSSSLLKDIENVWNDRIFYLSPHALNVSNRQVRLNDSGNDLPKWLSWIGMHDIDIILFPIHVNESHWSLAVAYINSRVYHIFDPLEPHTAFSNNSEEVTSVKHALSFLSEEYSKDYNVSQKWAFLANSKLATELNCFEQPNSFDFGVMVCLFIWAISSGCGLQSIPITSKENSTDNLSEVWRLLNLGRIAMAQNFFQLQQYENCCLDYLPLNITWPAVYKCDVLMRTVHIQKYLYRKTWWQYLFGDDNMLFQNEIYLMSILFYILPNLRTMSRSSCHHSLAKSITEDVPQARLFVPIHSVRWVL